MSGRGRFAAPAALARAAGAILAAQGPAFAQHPYEVGPPNEYLQRHHFGPVRTDTDADRACLGGFNSATPYARDTCMRYRTPGFTMTRTLDRPPPAPDGPIARAVDVPQAIAACWSPPGGASAQITVRAAFARDGRVLGSPRITYVAAENADAKEALRRSLLEALARCAPLRFTPPLGKAIAGRPFAIRFILPGRG